MLDTGRILKWPTLRFRRRPARQSDISKLRAVGRAVANAPFFTERMQLHQLAAQLRNAQMERARVREQVIVVLLDVLSQSYANVSLSDAADAVVAYGCKTFGLDLQEIRDLSGTISAVAERPAPKR